MDVAEINLPGADPGVDALKASALECTGDAILILTPGLRLIHANASSAVLFSGGMMVAGNGPESLFCGLRNRRALLALLEGGLQEPLSTVFTFVFDDREVTGFLSLHPGADPVGLTMVFRDESLCLRFQDRLANEEFIDRRTGFLNSRALDVFLEKEIQVLHDRNTGGSGVAGGLALFLMQITNLERLKSLYTTDMIDRIVEYAGDMVASGLPGGGHVFRQDEGRLVCLVPGLGRESIPGLAAALADHLAVPFHPEPRLDVHLQVVMGISHAGTCLDPLASAAALLGHAGAALGNARETGQAWLLYSREMHRQAVDRLQVRSGLSRAVNEKELQLRYMALMDASGRIRGLEALIRWQHPTRGLLPPEAFLPVAVDAHIIGALTRWVAYRVVEDWQAHLSDTDIFVTMNLSALDLDDLYLPVTIRNAIEGRMPPGALKVEITESECMKNFDQASLAMETFRSMGIDVLVDDFGVGHSSLSCLKDLAARYAKIDHSFARNVAESEEDRDFISHMVALCRLRGLQVVVEGVETQEQMDVLSGCGADLFQGFLFGRPMTMTQVKERWISVPR